MSWRAAIDRGCRTRSSRKLSSSGATSAKSLSLRTQGLDTSASVAGQSAAATRDGFNLCYIATATRSFCCGCVERVGVHLDEGGPGVAGGLLQGGLDRRNRRGGGMGAAKCLRDRGEVRRVEGDAER